VDIKIAEQFLDELFSSLEMLETQSAAVLQFLKDRGGATSEQLAPYMEQASKASNVRWRAARLRLMSLLSSAMKSAEEQTAKKPEASKEEAKTSEGKAKQAEGEHAGAQDGELPSSQAQPSKEQTQRKEATAEAEKVPITENADEGDAARPAERDVAPQKAGQKDAA
jgi:hypothetical protein